MARKYAKGQRKIVKKNNLYSRYKKNTHYHFSRLIFSLGSLSFGKQGIDPQNKLVFLFSLFFSPYKLFFVISFIIFTFLVGK